MAEILAFRHRAVGAHRNRDDAKDAAPAVKLLSALDAAGRILADLLLALLAELEDSSLRLSLVIERTAAEAEKKVLRAEQQELRATIAELKTAINDEAPGFNCV
jgi:hypothetical protein